MCILEKCEICKIGRNITWIFLKVRMILQFFAPFGGSAIDNRHNSGR